MSTPPGALRLPRPPFIGDVLTNPTRVVCLVDRETREFQCEPLEGSPRDQFGEHWAPSWPNEWVPAPIEPGWTERPSKRF